MVLAGLGEERFIVFNLKTSSGWQLKIMHAILYALRTNLSVKFECQKDIHFKTQLGPAVKNATPKPPTGN